MSTETLRKAAALIRERAEAATPGPWHQSIACSGTRIRGCSEVVPIIADADAEHIASWHPAVALAVADWLDAEAERWHRNFAATQQPSRGIDQPPAINYGDPEAAALNADHHARHALTVARAYLGADA